MADGFASLTSGLLARKGQARPAMRPQGFAAPTVGLDDLGWNDMGQDQPEQPRPMGVRLPAHLSGPHALTPAEAVAPAPVPEVVRQQEELVAAVETAPVSPLAVDPAPAVPSPVILAPVAAAVIRRPAPKTVKPVAAPRVEGRKAAFTLRLDAERHLRLRLACAVHNRSAQQLVIEALDALLGEMPDVDRLAQSLPAAKN